MTKQSLAGQGVPKQELGNEGKISFLVPKLLLGNALGIKALL
jgi:hypothetical protein